MKGDATLHEGRPPVASAFLRPHFPGPIIAAGGFNRRRAETIVEAGSGNLVAFGRLFSSDPDLPYRLKHNLPLMPYLRAAFWDSDEHGYTDFPTVEAPSGDEEPAAAGAMARAANKQPHAK